MLWMSLWFMPNGDIPEYYQYAQAFWLQHPRLHMLPAEYPPLAIVPFTLTLIPPLPDYQTVWAFWMGLLVLVVYFTCTFFTTRRRALTVVLYLLLAEGATLLGRYDLVPMLVTFAAFWAARYKHFNWSYVLLAAGILLKLYPVFVLPIFVIAHWRSVAGDQQSILPDNLRQVLPKLRKLWQAQATREVQRGVLLCAGLVLAGFALAYLRAPATALSSLSFAGNRPLQLSPRLQVCSGLRRLWASTHTPTGHSTRATMSAHTS